MSVLVEEGGDDEEETGATLVDVVLFVAAGASADLEDEDSDDEDPEDEELEEKGSPLFCRR